MSLLRMLVKKKAKESLNSSEPDEQQATTRPTISDQITANEGPSTSFPSQEESGKSRFIFIT